MSAQPQAQMSPAPSPVRWQPVQFDKIPTELTTTLRWAVWRAGLGNDGKIKKAPRSPEGSFRISTTRPQAWSPFDRARIGYERGGFDGIGVLLQADAGIVGIDLDNVRQLLPANQDLKHWLRKAREAQVYAEQSPSGNGLRLFIRGSLPNKRGRRKGGIEVYNHARFLTVTGHVLWPGVLPEHQALIDELLRLIGPDEQSVQTALPVAQGAPNSNNVAALSKLVAEREPILWAGTWKETGDDLSGGLGYPSQSEADMALVGALVRQARSLGVTDEALSGTVLAAFEQSGL